MDGVNKKYSKRLNLTLFSEIDQSLDDVFSYNVFCSVEGQPPPSYSLRVASSSHFSHQWTPRMLRGVALRRSSRRPVASAPPEYANVYPSSRPRSGDAPSPLSRPVRVRVEHLSGRCSHGSNQTLCASITARASSNGSLEQARFPDGRLVTHRHWTGSFTPAS